MYPKTGRTHQLRGKIAALDNAYCIIVHCASVLNTPIVGDSKYKNRESSGVSFSTE